MPKIRRKLLRDWRLVIKREVDSLNDRPFSHNIITLALNAIDSRFGSKQANKAVRDFELDELGWKQKSGGKCVEA